MSKVFKPVKECIELAKQGVPCDTGFSYMYSCEETSFEDFNINGDVEKQLEEVTEHGSWMVKVAEDGDDPFDEFTKTICPAYLAPTPKD